MDGNKPAYRFWVASACFLLALVLLARFQPAILSWSSPEDTNSPASPVKRSSSAIAITTDGTTLLVVNPDSNSLTLVDTNNQSVLAELPVGVDPRTVTVDDVSQRAFVANRGSDSISIVNLATQQTITETLVGDRPYGALVSPDGSRLYVAVQGADRLTVLDTTTLEVIASLATADRPSGLAMSGDGRTLYITHLLSNTITALTVRPFSRFLPVVVNSEQGGTETRLTANQPSFDRDVNFQASIALWPDSNLVQSIVITPDGSRAYVPHTRSNTSNRALTFDSTVFPLISLIDLTTRQHLVGQQLDLGTLDPPGVGLPFDAAFGPSGEELWIANAASNDITVIDLTSGGLAAHIEVQDNPRAIVLSPDGTTAYVNNTLAGTVSVIDTATYTVTDTITVTDIPLPPALLNGKRLFHSSDDPRISRAQWVSCNTCHFEGEHDGRIWFFGFAGPRNTTSLFGMIETYPLRWSGEWDESADSEFANRRENFGSGLIDGAMNCSLAPPDCVNHPPNQGRSYDLDCLAALIDSLQMRLSPAHADGEPLTPAEQRGQAIFADASLGCVTCHPPPLYTDLIAHNVGTATPDEQIGPAYDTPTLRGLYDSAPYFHDGSAATLYEALTRTSPEDEHDVRNLLSETEIQDLVAFLLALPFHY